MTLNELTSAVNGLNDGGSAQVIASKVIDSRDNSLAEQFIEKMLQKCAEGHHQTKEFAIAGLKVLNGTK